MKIKKYIGNKLDNLCAATFATAGSLGAMQFPQFLSQYTQRIDGKLNGLKEVENITNNIDIINTINKTQEGLDAILNTESLNKIVEFVKHIDIDSTYRTLENFTPGVTIESDTVLYGVVGLLVGTLGYEMLKDGAKYLRYNKQKTDNK